jgi:predicted phage terminase large subunit-like protein
MATSQVYMAEVLDAVLRSDPYSFIQAAFPIVSGEQSLVPNWHIEAMAAALTRVKNGDTKRLIITVPPRSLKSICASVAFPAFVLGHDPTRKIICVSYSESLARKHANDTRALMRSARYRRVFPATRISAAKDTELEIVTTARGGRLTTSVGGTITGRGGNLIVIDDPMKPQDAQSETTRENVKQWYSNTLLSRLDSKVDGCIVVVMQRLHLDDLVGHLLDAGGWEHLNLPAIAEVEEKIALGNDRIYLRTVGSVLHAEREPIEKLDELKRTMGSMDFSAQYLQAPVPAGGHLIKWNWFQSYDDPPSPWGADKIIVSWDTALSSHQLADYSACVVMLVRRGAVYILDVIRERLEYPELKRRVLAEHRRWGSAGCEYLLLIEKTGSGMSLLQELRQRGIYAISVKPTGDKVMRMAAQTAVIESGAVHLPKRAPWLDDFRKEVLAFPQSKHDDQVDALSQGLQRAFAPAAPVAQFDTFEMVGWARTPPRRPSLKRSFP